MSAYGCYYTCLLSDLNMKQRKKIKNCRTKIEWQVNATVEIGSNTPTMRSRIKIWRALYYQPKDQINQGSNPLHAPIESLQNDITKTEAVKLSISNKFANTNNIDTVDGNKCIFDYSTLSKSLNKGAFEPLFETEESNTCISSQLSTGREIANEFNIASGDDKVGKRINKLRKDKSKSTRKDPIRLEFKDAKIDGSYVLQISLPKNSNYDVVVQNEMTENNQIIVNQLGTIMNKDSDSKVAENRPLSCLNLIVPSPTPILAAESISFEKFHAREMLPTPMASREESSQSNTEADLNSQSSIENDSSRSNTIVFIEENDADFKESYTVKKMVLLYESLSQKVKNNN